MANIIGDLAVRIGADVSGLTSGMAKANTQLSQLKTEAVAGTKELGKYAAGATAAGAALVTALVGSSIQATKELSNLAAVANTSVSEFSKLAYGAKTVGVEADKLSDIYKDMSDRVGDFLNTGGGPMADYFDQIAPKIGQTAEEFRNLSGPQALQMYVDGLEQANLSQSEMTFYMEAVASDATALLPLLRENGAAMSDLASEADALGISLSDIQAAQIEQVAVAFGKVSDITSGLVDQYTARLAPILTALAQQFVDTAKDAGGVAEAADSAFGYTVKAVGFVMDAIEGVNRAFQLAGKAVAGFGLGSVEVLLRVANAIVNKPIQAINELVAKLNDFAGTDFEPIGITNLGTAIQRELQTVIDAQGIAIEDMHNLLMKPLPSTQFEEYVAQAQDASEQVARAMVAAQTTRIGGSGEGSGNNKTEDDKNAKLMGELQGRLALIQEANTSELDLLKQKEEAEKAVLDEAKAAKLLSAEEYQEQLTATEARYSAERQKLADAETAAKISAFRGMFGDLSTLMNSESRKMFEIGKAAALAGAVVDGYASIVGAYKVGASIGGPALGAAFGAAAAAATFAQIQQIQSASFGRGGSSSTGSVTSSINATGEAVSGAGSTGQTITLTPVNPSDLFTGQQVLDLVNEAVTNGGQLVSA